MPGESDAPGIADPLGLIAAAVPAGILAGTLTVTAAVFVVTLLREGAPTAVTANPAASPTAWVLLGGTLLGVLVAAVCLFGLLFLGRRLARLRVAN